MFKAVLFDLDGTLLPHDYDAFEKKLFGAYARFFAERLPRVDVVGPMLPSVAKMVANDGTRTNEDVFWDAYAQHSAEHRKDGLVPLFLEFYATHFPDLRGDIPVDPDARAAVEAARARGVKVALATNAVFPRVAILERLLWSGIDASSFDLIACFEDHHFCKPRSGYYLELASMLGVAPSECLMVGNDIEMDIKPAAKVGMRTVMVENAFQLWQDKSVKPDHIMRLSGVADLL